MLIFRFARSNLRPARVSRCSRVVERQLNEPFRILTRQISKLFGGRQFWWAAVRTTKQDEER